MPVDRRHLLAGATTLAVGALVRPLPTLAATASLTEIAPGIHVHQGRHELFSPSNAGDIANTGFIVGRDAVAVVDTGGSAGVGQALADAIRAVTDRPVRYVINTHMHPDHVLGNAAFRAEGVTFLAHHKMARGLAARAQRYMSVNRQSIGEAGFAGTEIVLPDRGISGSEEIDLGGRTLLLTARATAHTDNDLTVLDHQTGTAFLGDLLFSGHVPTIDGSIRGWISVLHELADERLARVVPGHGPPAMAWPDAARPLQRYLDAVASDVRAMIKKGMTLTDASRSAASGEQPAWQLFGEYHPRNVSAAFAELEWE